MHCLSRGAVPPTPFIIVALVATGTLLVGWRAALAAVTKVWGVQWRAAQMATIVEVWGLGRDAMDGHHGGVGLAAVTKVWSATLRVLGCPCAGSCHNGVECGFS